MDRGYKTIEHTADVAVEFWAPTEQELLVEGAKAVIDLLTEGTSVTAQQARAFELDAVDAEDRLVRWLNEVLWLALSEGFLTHEADLRLDERGLGATVRGEAGAGSRITSELKSATYHDLMLQREPGGSWRARVVIDV